MCQKPLINYPTRVRELSIFFGIFGKVLFATAAALYTSSFSFNSATKAGKVRDLKSILYLKM